MRSSSPVPIFVPIGETPIRPASAVVGTGQGDRILVDYEGGRPGMPFEERLAIAAGRHAAHAPTIARALLPKESLRRVGTALHSHALAGWWVAEITDPDALASWLGAEPLPRIGGSVDAWRRAAGIHLSRNMNAVIQGAARGKTPLQAAISGLIAQDASLGLPPSISDFDPTALAGK